MRRTDNKLRYFDFSAGVAGRLQWYRFRNGLLKVLRHFSRVRLAIYCGVLDRTGAITAKTICLVFTASTTYCDHRKLKYLLTSMVAILARMLDLDTISIDIFIMIDRSFRRTTSADGSSGQIAVLSIDNVSLSKKQVD